MTTRPSPLTLGTFAQSIALRGLLVAPSRRRRRYEPD